MEKIRCAIYCRKSVEKGLDMEFNSLDAQREAGEAYVASQKANGWVCLPERYDDGGISGATLNRPGLQKLLADCEAGKVDVIVVYKIDRLSRSLCDFADLSRLFEKWNVAFVSVTQEINTHTSAGRMMLNILMTFAQFEREMIATRIKDKMAATRKKGKWVGGQVPYGYRVENKKLLVEPEKAAVVQRIFRRYLEIQSSNQIAHELNADGIKTVTNKEWDKPRVYNLLTNHTYVGDVFYEGEVYPGEQEAIIDRETWDMVQAFLHENDPIRDPAARFKESNAALSGLIRCGHCGRAMLASRSTRRGRIYHYYRCSGTIKQGNETCPIKSVSAGDIEKVVCDELLPVLHSQEVVASVARQTGMKEQAVMEMVDEDFWTRLLPVEKQRLMRILVDHVTINEDGIEIELKTETIKSVQEVYRAENP